VLSVVLFAAFWVVLGLGVFFLAIRGGPSAAVDSRGGGSYRSRKALGWTLAVIYVAFGVVIPVAFLVGNRNQANAQVGRSELTQREKRGRQIFGQRCGLCHTLAAANAVGKVGPNLDIIQPSEGLVLQTIQNGCLPNPPPGSHQACLGNGVMPADVVQGVDAEDVAKFVSAVAGRE
jgi:mono/diheme cytochrome c family protein